MTRYEQITLANVDTIGPRDLREEARRSLEAVAETGRDASGGILRDIILFVEPHHANRSITVTTVAFRSSAGDRAGQVTNGNAVWGDWNSRGGAEYLVTDDGVIVWLDGTEAEVPSADEITALAAEAGEHGDARLIETCRRAEGRDSVALVTVARVLAAARAQRDDEV